MRWRIKRRNKESRLWSAALSCRFLFYLSARIPVYSNSIQPFLLFRIRHYLLRTYPESPVIFVCKVRLSPISLVKDRLLLLSENLPLRPCWRAYFPHPPCPDWPSIPWAEKIINLSVQLVPKGKKKNQRENKNIMSTTNQTNPNGRMTIDDIMQRDSQFRYMLLSRLQSDCEYYLNHGNRHPKCLWAGNEAEQIEFMTRLYDSFKDDEKPEWLTMDKIMEYSKEMIPSNEQPWQGSSRKIKYRNTS